MTGNEQNTPVTDKTDSPTLPDWCYTILPSSGALIIVERDVNGYGKLPESTNNPQVNRNLATEYNTQIGVMPQQEAAMLGGSMFGWDTPAARVTSYNENGVPLIPSKQANTVEVTAESRFLNSSTDSFAIYQLKYTDDNRNLRFESLARIQEAGMSVDRTNYELVYTAPLQGKAATLEHLNRLFEQFNIHRPADFAGHSLSVSDVVALKQDGQITCHYVDRWSFAELPAFLQPDNPLKNAEMAVEDDYGMIDGIINNGKSSAVKEAEKPSVLAQLRTKPDNRVHNANAPIKSAERGTER